MACAGSAAENADSGLESKTDARDCNAWGLANSVLDPEAAAGDGIKSSVWRGAGMPGGDTGKTAWELLLAAALLLLLAGDADVDAGCACLWPARGLMTGLKTGGGDLATGPEGLAAAACSGFFC